MLRLGNPDSRTDAKRVSARAQRRRHRLYRMNTPLIQRRDPRTLSAHVLLALGTFGLAAASPVAPQSSTNGSHGGSHTSPPQSALEALGRELFFDDSLSTPQGQSCASCHAPEAGFRFPRSDVNERYGVAPGVLPNRFGFRSVPTISYAAFIPAGPIAHLTDSLRVQPMGELLFIGGQFWDGRARDLETQATFPFQNPNEMNDLVHNLGSPRLVVRRLYAGPTANDFRRTFGEGIFAHPDEEVFEDLCSAIAAYERTPEVSPFTSRYDAYLLGRVRLTEEEFDGLCLMTGTTNGKTVGRPYHKNAHCINCHMIEDDPADGPSLFTLHNYENLGVPRNRGNPFYAQTDETNNPAGSNPLGAHFRDLGLGDFIYPLNGLPPGNRGPGSDGYGDYLAANGVFKTPTLRNVDKRPYPNFVKAYMHNGVFKSLEDVVHFYNTRNLTKHVGEVIDFTRPDPYADLMGEPLWPAPEMALASSLANPRGDAAADGGEIGNLGLTPAEEQHIVAFLKTLSDGYFERP